MPHQCVRCSEIFDDGAKEILSGCSCGSKLFFFIKRSKYEQLKNTEVVPLTNEQKDQIEKDIYELTGVDPDSDQPVILDFESIRIAQPGKYELDLVNLFRKDPVIFKLSDGKYMIDLAQTFDALKKEK